MKRIALPIKKPEVWFWIIALVFLLTGALLCWLVWQHPEQVGLMPNTPQQDRWLTGLMVGTGVLACCALLTYAGTRLSGKKHFDEIRQQAQGDDIPKPEKVEKDKSQNEMVLLKRHLRLRYGLFWRNKVRLLMVMGETEQVAALAPTLATQGWLEGQRTLLIFGGSLHEEGDHSRLAEWRKLRRTRPLDGIVWALADGQSRNAKWVDDGLRSLEKIGDTLRYQPAVYLWQVIAGETEGLARAEQSIGAIFPAKMSPKSIESQLKSLTPRLREQGLQQVFVEQQHDFLLRFAQSLESGTAAYWGKILHPVARQLRQTHSFTRLDVQPTDITSGPRRRP
ncbi:Uncharacterized protein conserved in bacteria [Ewingella americana]|uniref:Uncharacterized protein conserved in bacteria n=1 Tax=Ewingella americana TaxID=41202 RepID=A0A377NE72_9GAMM|nr:Uncharacterized protein conserved in bacteria [Ewingella americana]